MNPPAQAATHRVARRQAVIAGSVLAIFVLLLYAPLLWTNRVYASGDILLYFYPYRDYAAAALRGGQIPLWNPYSFLGVPLLANPQAAVLYPLHWPLSWLPVTRQIAWSAALHTWILGIGGYALLRRWGQSGWAALVAGLVLAGSGFYGGLAGHINQMNGAAWLPWALWVLAGVDATGGREWRAGLRRAAEFGLLVALMFLAGHTQTVFINLAGLGAWIVWPLVWPPLWQRREPWRARLNAILPRLEVYALGVALGLLLSGAQLLPTLELSRLGLRSGGLSYAEASSFSLKPLHLLWTLFPSYGLADLSVVFATMGYSEFVAYVGLLGLGLAAWGGWRGRGAAQTTGLLLAGLGLFLALGRWNPVYFLLYWAVPGFDLFRVPARWMMLYTLGMAILAGVGVDAWRARLDARRAGLLLSLGMALGVALIGVELILAAQALPHTHPTAPQAVYDVRTAPAHLRTDPARAALHPAAAGRFVSMSTLTFDPGDMADYRRILREGARPLLRAADFAELITALKSQEILAPNLALLWRVPSVDGFDGGVLPLRRYLDLVTLFVPPAEMVPDGRLREQLHSVPPAGLLALLNVQYVITDKVRDLWFEDVYYDRQIGARLDAAYPRTSLDIPGAFPATHLHLVGYVDGDAAALAGGMRTVGRVRMAGVTDENAAEGAVQADFELTAGDRPGAQLADPALDSPLATAAGAVVVYRDVEGGRQEYLVELPLPAAMRPTTITVAWQDAPAALVIQAATLVDARTGQFAALLPSDRGHFRLVHSGDVKVYENLDVLPRAYLAQQVVAAPDADAALGMVRSRAATLAGTAVVEGWPESIALPAAQGAQGEAQLLSYAPEQVVIRTRSQAPALLVLADTFYPGWRATVDGDPAPIYRTNVLLRGVPVPAGEHEVVLRYVPASWRQGLLLSAAGGLLLLLCWAAPGWAARP